MLEKFKEFLKTPSAHGHAPRQTVALPVGDYPRMALHAPPPPARIDLIGIDLDGTLLRSDNSIKPDVLRAVKRATAMGVHVVIVTARPPRDVNGIHEALGLNTVTINFNGALIYDVRQNKKLQHLSIDKDMAKKMVKIARKIEPDILLRADIGDKWYTDKFEGSVGSGNAHVPDFIGPLDAIMSVGVTKLMFVAKSETIDKVRYMINRKFGKHVDMPVSDKRLLNVVHHDVEKATALQWVAAHYGVKREAIMAIGDAPNDSKMIQWAGWGVAVANAWPEVQDLADAVVCSNNQGGVGMAIEEFVLKER
ncbi:MAG: Cof-type HAD-IIB family hydrolase [Phycisphaera sp.]|nr:Cof-type HAD-IIB family hydrolase [Phycisphaera sp.]